MLDEGESLLGAAGGTPQPWWEATPDGQAWIPGSPEDVFCNDCSESDAAWAVPQLGHSPFLSQPDEVVKLLTQFA
jgi:hypothetical protein